MKRPTCLFAVLTLLWAGGEDVALGSDAPQATAARIAGGRDAQDAASVASRLTALEAEHARQAGDWETAIRGAATPAARDSLETLVPGWKQAQRREWLTLRLEQETARGDQDKIDRLQAELGRVTPPLPRPATAFVPRPADNQPAEAPGQGGAK